MSPEELKEIAQTETEAHEKFEHRFHVCMAAGCLSAHAEQVKDALDQEVKAKGLEHRCQVKGVGCMGLCAAGPLVQSAPDGTLYQGVTAADAAPLVENLGKPPLKKLQCRTDVPFFQQQQKIVLEHCGLIDPERIEDYIRVGGYTALAKVLTEMSPGQVIDEMIKSGLRGRGGAGFPTGLKWSTVAKAQGERKFVVCNADEGDPGAFMDRSVLESDPHRVLEGLAIAAYTVGAQQGFIYVRAEYPLAVERLNTAIRQARRQGLLGNGICGTTFNFDLELRLGAGAFVCGEETALLASIEGKRGSPRPRPPFPAEHGLWGSPTLLNNVETYANITPIILKGGAWFAGIGTEKSKGTKVFALAGRIHHTGLIEVPMGTTLRQIIFDIGGGIPDGKSFKAVQTGGPSGGCIPAQHLDVAVDYDSLKELGSIMGSGGMIVMDDTADMVDVARYFMEFCMTESCGKCVPCRVGTAQLHNMLVKIAAGQASRADIELMEELCDLVRNASLCGLGQTAPNPVLSTLRYFREEYEKHLTEEVV